MHEFGHNLGLYHGGDESTNYKPNYYSIMNYLYQMQGLPVIGSTEGDRYYYERMYMASNSTEYSNWFWLMNHRYDVNDVYNDLGPAWTFYLLPLDFKNSPFSSSFKIDYSHGYGGPVKETNLYETSGLRQSGSGSVDWNGNGSITDGITENINSSYDSSYSILYDYDDWHNLRYYYANYAGGGLSLVDETPQIVTEYDKPLNFLLDLELSDE